MNDEALSNGVFQIMKGNGLDAKTFFPEVYQSLIGKNMGPKLGAFLIAIGPKRAAEILKNAL